MCSKKSHAYDEVRFEAEKPIEQRRVIGGGTVRRYHMSEDDAERMRREFRETGRFPNPYKYGGIAYAIIEALVGLGINEKHSFLRLREKIKEIMLELPGTKNHPNAWASFEAKKSRNNFTGKDLNGRILQNIYMYQRLNGYHPYGEKLRQLNSCIDIYVDNNGLPLFMLNTNFDDYEQVKPVNKMNKKR